MGLCVGDFHSDPLEPQEETVSPGPGVPGICDQQH